MLAAMASPQRALQPRFAVPSFIALVGLSGCLASPFPKTPEAGGPAWQRITTEHFVVDTDLETVEAETLVRQLENLRKVETQVVFGGDLPQGQRMRVFALRQDEYGHFDRVASGNFVSWSLYQPLLIIAPGGEWDTFASDVRKHELAH